MNRASRCILHQPLVAFGDLLLVHLGFIVAFAVVWERLTGGVKNFLAYVEITPLISAATLVVFYVSDLYSNWLHRTLSRVTLSVALAVALNSMVTMALTFWERRFAFPRSVLVVAIGIQILLILPYRFLLHRLHRRASQGRRVLVIDENEEGMLPMAQTFLECAAEWFRVTEFLRSPEVHKLESKLKDVEVVLLGADVRNKAEIVALCAQHGREVLIVPRVFELSLVRAEVRDVDDVLLLAVRPPTLHSAQVLLKRAVDLVGATALLFTAGPVIVVLYFLIPLLSEGNAIFRQERVGLDGRPFYIYKFRTMTLDAEKATGPVLASERDPRITRLGRLLRATRLDELPQLLNVIRGDMSLVGPRPERPFFVTRFADMMPNYLLRLSVKPGITGLAQVMGKYSTTAERKLRFDLMYVYSYSFLLDLKIMVQTLRVVFQREKSAGLGDQQIRSMGSREPQKECAKRAASAS